MDNKKIIGDLGEDFAAKILFAKGYSIVETKYRCKIGEVDIIASLGDELIFTEVKTRQSLSMGHPCEAVSADKQRRIRNVAEFFIQKNKRQEAFASFQVIEILVNIIDNAF